MPWVDDEFVLLYNFEADRNAGQPDSRISATKVMEMFRDVATGMERSLNVYGTNPPTEHYDWNGKRIINAAAGAEATDFATVGQVPTVGYAGTLTEGADVNTLSATVALAPATIPAGYAIVARLTNSITGASTVSVNAGTRVALTDRSGNALASGDVVGDSFFVMRYDGSGWRIETPIASETAAGTIGLSNVSSPLTGNGTSSALDIDFSTMSLADARAIATAVMGDATAAATVISGITGTPVRLTCSDTEPTGDNAAPGSFWFRSTEEILFIRVTDGDDTDVWLDISTPNGGTAAGPASVSTGSIQDEAVTNAKLAHATANTIKGNTSATTAAVTDLTGAQANLLLNDALPTNVVASAASTYTPDMAVAVLHDLTMTGTVAIAAPSNAAAGQIIIFRLEQDATGGRTASWNAAYNFGISEAPLLSTAPGDADYVTGIVRGTGDVEMLSFVAGF